jgi:hypothetical protein
MGKNLSIYTFTYNDIIYFIKKQIVYINDIPHIECSYLKKFLPITDFRKRRGTEGWIIEQPSRPGAKQWSWDTGRAKPEFETNKEIDGIMHRFCGELKIYFPLSEFTYSIKNGKKKYRAVSKKGKIIENQRNKESTRKAIKRWKKNNKHKLNESYAKRRAMEKHAMPKWLTKDHINVIRDIYRQRVILSESKDKKSEYHVHHIFPLLGKDKNGNHISCGLHVPWNLIIIPQNINASILSKNMEYHDHDLSIYKNIQPEYTQKILEGFIF